MTVLNVLIIDVRIELSFDAAYAGAAYAVNISPNTIAGSGLFIADKGECIRWSRWWQKRSRSACSKKVANDFNDSPGGCHNGKADDAPKHHFFPCGEFCFVSLASDNVLDNAPEKEDCCKYEKNRNYGIKDFNLDFCENTVDCCTAHIGRYATPLREYRRGVLESNLYPVT